jgi:hypothetical protein
MDQGFVNLGNLIPGERYSFTTQQFPNVRSQGTFDRVIVNPGMDNQYLFLNVLEPNGSVANIANYANLNDYPRNIISLVPAGAPPHPPARDRPAGAPHGGGSKSRKTKRRRHRKSKRTRKSKRRR